MRKAATVGGLVLFIVFMVLSLLHCGSDGICVCPLGHVCVRTEKAWRCEPSPMPPTWLQGGDGGVEEASQ